jgi:aspartyl-tRNA(Asn)/glutamyl-tRNA(Gln) amidotransferase subunit A
LSQTLDSIGPLARSVACCALIDAVMAGEAPTLPPALPIAGLRLGAPQRFVLDAMDKTVSEVYGAALTRLSKAGARIVEIPFAELETLPSINAKGGIVTAEAYAIHRKLIAEAGERYDPRVGGRIKRGSVQDAADYIDLLAARRALIARAAAISAPFDALIMPTVPIVAPEVAPLVADDDLYMKTNALVLRNPSVWNFLDRCALSIPCHAPGEAPVGLMLVGEHGGDRRLLSVGLAVESALER